MKKPKKPHADFPLTPHNCGKWCKKIKGRMHYFGSWEDPGEALQEYLAAKDYLLAGQEPPNSGNSYTIQDACEDFYDSRRKLHVIGQLTAHTLNDYDTLHRQLIGHFGNKRAVSSISPEDWRQLREQKQQTWGPKTLSNFIGRTKAVFSWCYQAGKIPEPMKFGLGFKKPSKAVMRKLRHAKPRREFTAEELRELLTRSSGSLRAMILLAINGGLGQMDLSLLEFRHLEERSSWVVYPRPKTGILREFALWPETQLALQEAIAQRPSSRSHPDNVFVTRFGVPWVRQTEGSARSDAISLQFNKLKQQAGIAGPSKGFYAIRHTFRTVADECRDQPAIMHVMGHGDESMSGVYREQISRERLLAVTNHVRRWLFLGPWPNA